MPRSRARPEGSLRLAILREAMTLIGTDGAITSVAIEEDGAGFAMRCAARLPERATLAVAKARFNGLPAFLMTEGLSVRDISPELAESLSGAIWLTEDTPRWVVGHIRTAMQQYHDSLLPPFFGALTRYVNEYRYSWHTPGHMGGLVFRAVVAPGDVVLLDRNCHKSIVNSVIQTGAIPVWLQSARSALGLIGPIRAADLDPDAIRAKIAANPLLAGRTVARARLAVVTNSTYDGTMYNTGQLIARLGQVAEHVLLDEAWIPYAAFHPVYAGHFGMASGGERDALEDGSDTPIVITTMSTHKMLAALSQASMIHIKQGRTPLPGPRFNEAFMLHTSTSPRYGIVARSMSPPR